MSCGVGGRWGSDLALLWLWHRPAATAPILPLAWELPYAMGLPLKKKKRKERKKERLCTLPAFPLNLGIYISLLFSYTFLNGLNTIFFRMGFSFLCGHAHKQAIPQVQRISQASVFVPVGFSCHHCAQHACVGTHPHSPLQGAEAASFFWKQAADQDTEEVMEPGCSS